MLPARNWDVTVETAHALAVRERDPVGASDRGAGAAGREQGGRDDDTYWVGAVRSPPGWFRRRVDEHLPALGLGDGTREALEHRRQDLQMRGLCEEGAHNAAWVEVGVDDRYRRRLSSRGQSHDERTRTVAVENALDALAALAEDGRVVLATDRQPGFRCHRTVLAEELAARRSES